MHPRNRHQGQYDFRELTKVSPELAAFVVRPFDKETIDFSNPRAVKALNRALLITHYGIRFWDIPEKFLCPPIPGRADYVHTISELVGGKRDSSVRVLDIGTGANVIYPLLGHAEYDWSFVGSEINAEALEAARSIIQKNELGTKIEIRLQTEKKIFTGIIREDEKFHLSMCNPPFHASAEEALKGTERKWKNLKLKKAGTHRNFGGSADELWCSGGEKEFVSQMIRESKIFGDKCRWFTTLVSKDENLRAFEKLVKTSGGRDLKILAMEQGQKKSRALAWTFL